MPDADEPLALALRSGLPFCGLRGFAVDPRLWHYVPTEIARRERVVPVVLVGDVLKVAAPSPDADLARVRRSFPQLEVELHLARPDEVDEVLAREEPVAR